MRRLLLSAAVLGAALLGATAAQAFKYEYLPSEKCTLKKVEVEDVQFCGRLKRNFNTSCLASGGVTQQEGKACKLPDAKVGAFRDHMIRQTGLPGPYNPIPKGGALTKEPDPGKGCVKGSEHLPGSVCPK